MNADPYQALVMERSRKPLFARRPHGTDAEGEGRNRMCGDAVHVFLARAGMHVGHESEGCAILLASADLMAEAVAGKSRDEVFELQRDFLAMVKTGQEKPALGALNALAGLASFPARQRCATLPWDALSEALNNG